MNNEKDILEEYLEKDTSGSKYYNLLLVCMLLYILYNSFGIYGQDAHVDAWRMIFTWIIPVAGFIFVYFKKRTGWAICAVYYTVILGFMLLTFFKKILDHYTFSFNGRQSLEYYSFLVLLILNTVFLWLGPVRKKLQLVKGYTITALVISAVLLLLVALETFVGF